MDCSAFLNWNEEILKSESEKVVVFRSLVATVKFQPVFDASLEAKAVKFLESLDPENLESSDAFLSSLRQISDDSLTNFVQCIGVLISSSYQVITSRAMAMLRWLLTFCSDRNILILVKADLVPRLINTLNPLSLSTTEQVYVHTNLIQIISNSLSPSTPYGLKNVAIKDGSEQQAVLETILKQVLVPSGNVSEGEVNKTSTDKLKGQRRD
ncbi:hypothetical protein BLNAU_4039 [Blattamonas nauphoetae]|uniref:Uncharacterized protein n=1 Tax=Blattamonas nauphoetae TaxID=2049346 RepID=A0ABQ9YB43_9EUKA|nr:hypothetical protein BLNAU_4039 [Blattamonas nauphoetae]